jgi:alkanesulfonate monooxygenase SsuD/methylene tetrahydromethanopterin reductase-like flavin-dependent oxidoreductase (luciferase family)
MAAAQIAMVDHLVGGRLLLGVGPGVAPDAEALEDRAPDRREQCFEALEQILAIWRGEPPYRIEGRFHRISTERWLDRAIGVGEIVRPLQRPHPPILVTSIRPDSTGPFDAGSRGWGGISATYVGDHVVRAHIEAYRRGRLSAGLSADTSGWRVARSLFVARDEATARAYAKQRSGAHGFYFQVMRSKLARFGGLPLMGDEPGAPAGELELERTLERLVIAGTPDRVADEILAFRERVGPFGTLLYTGHDWVDPALARTSMELMRSEVWPRVLAGLR